MIYPRNLMLPETVAFGCSSAFAASLLLHSISRPPVHASLTAAVRSEAGKGHEWFANGSRHLAALPMITWSYINGLWRYTLEPV
jgi:hypothetical protein